MKSWGYLVLAIVTEVISTSFVKIAVTVSPVIGYSVMAIFISLSYFFLSNAIKVIPLGVAYIMWEGLGLLLLSIVSWLFLDEHFSPEKIAAIGVLLTGITLINIGEQLSEGT